MHQTAMPWGFLTGFHSDCNLYSAHPWLNCAIKWPECIMVNQHNTILMLALECPPAAIRTLYPCVWSGTDIYWTVPQLESAAACLHHCPDMKARQQQLSIFNE